VHLDLIDRHTAAIEEITARIEVVIEQVIGTSGEAARQRYGQLIKH